MQEPGRAEHGGEFAEMQGAPRFPHELMRRDEALHDGECIAVGMQRFEPDRIEHIDAGLRATIGRKCLHPSKLGTSGLRGLKILAAFGVEHQRTPGPAHA